MAGSMRLGVGWGIVAWCVIDAGAPIDLLWWINAWCLIDLLGWINVCCPIDLLLWIIVWCPIVSSRGFSPMSCLSLHAGTTRV